MGALTGYVLGTQLTGLGGERWSVKPVVAGTNVSWARGVLPTAFGGLGVSWMVEAGGAVFELAIDVPPGTSGVVSVPMFEEGGRVEVDGEVAWANGTGEGYGASFEGGYVSLQGIGGGKHEVRVTNYI